VGTDVGAEDGVDPGLIAKLERPKECQDVEDAKVRADFLRCGRHTVAMETFGAAKAADTGEACLAPTVAFWGQKLRPPTIRPPTGLRGAFGGLVIWAGVPENAVFGAGQPGMTLSDHHTHTIWCSGLAPPKMRFLAVGLLASWRSELAPAKTRFGRRPPRRGARRRPLRQRVVPTRPLGGAESATVCRPHPFPGCGRFALDRVRHDGF
jgi:hypothetical protein